MEPVVQEVIFRNMLKLIKIKANFLRVSIKIPLIKMEIFRRIREAWGEGYSEREGHDEEA